MCTLVSKYNVPGPRYTSYPTVPYWDPDTFSLLGWKGTITESFNQSKDREGISLYIHLPFCESMCTFCGCNKRITKNHEVEVPYLRAVIRELQLYVDLLRERPLVSQLHLGGGTPTFFSPDHLDRLLSGIFSVAKKAVDFDGSFEGHPNNTKREHLQVLASHGFTRVCYGVQDYNERVQRAIHRIQPFINVERATTMAREEGYVSVGHDIIYGLPFQTQEDVISTIEKTILLRPDRIAFYSYAHVPWIKGNGQRGFKETDLPSAEQKRLQYETGKDLLLKAGYVEIGMDHFALPTDDLYLSQQQGKLHRNFMGYATNPTQLMLGLGVSAISDSWYGFAQNVKSVEEYQEMVNNGILPVYRGHLLTEEDLMVRKHILNIMCRFETYWEDTSLYFEEIPQVITKLSELEKDGLVLLLPNGIRITEKGRVFVRNICLPFDLRLQRKKPGTQLFSMTV
ncbi:oxygen-independent coproporphyrinogen III oxidase [Aureisphaera galaxeae]|uniref:oxygen-independent coproporphyrinogen III oxidase n=1 Tax=Aureisphaera galaxeae TaxID=1538023 RepID=UPI00234FD9BC|nr:oxygen-independent coproporphyrinogen III oxidase [Aureisphaera galaxeae]MDC8005203.1 oxygen-independent coproporphyrinogen III oxidase [Aureisphaera galaxeae]